jgi:hypothetical protein
MSLMTALSQGMKELIDQAFLCIDVIGPHVKAGHFDMMGPDRQIILPSEWDRFVEPGWEVTMHIWPVEKASRFGRLPRPPTPTPPGHPGAFSDAERTYARYSGAKRLGDDFHSGRTTSPGGSGRFPQPHLTTLNREPPRGGDHGFQLHEERSQDPDQRHQRQDSPRNWSGQEREDSSETHAQDGGRQERNHEDLTPDSSLSNLMAQTLRRLDGRPTKIKAAILLRELAKEGVVARSAAESALKILRRMSKADFDAQVGFGNRFRASQTRRSASPSISLDGTDGMIEEEHGPECDGLGCEAAMDYTSDWEDCDQGDDDLSSTLTGTCSQD